MRIPRVHKLISLLLLLTLFLPMAYAESYAVNDFAWNAPLSDAETSLRQVILPLTIYKNMQRRDYGDLRVFSAEGQVVPHQFKQTAREQKTEEAGLVFYPFSKEQAANPANIRVIIDQKSGQQHLDINQQISDGKPAKNNEFQYIIENPDRKLSLCKLKLDWEQSKPSMILPLSLESSDNLRGWTSLGHSLNVSSLSYSGAQLTHKEVEFSCTRQKYLRLTWLKQEQQAHLKKISGVYTQDSEQAIQWKSFGKPVYDKNQNWLFESDVIAALSYMEFAAPQDGLLYKGVLYSRNDKDAPWKFRKNIIQYRLNIGDAKLQSDAFSFRPNSDRYWKLELTDESGFTADQLPEIRAGWKQEQLVFLAQGTAPFRLAYGNPNIKPVNNTGLTQLVRSFEDTGAIPDTVTVGQPQQIRDMPGIEKKIPWKKIGLWALLLIGTAVLAYMALSLYRQMDNNQGSPE